MSVIYGKGIKLFDGEGNLIIYKNEKEFIDTIDNAEFVLFNTEEQFNFFNTECKKNFLCPIYTNFIIGLYVKNANKEWVHVETKIKQLLRITKLINYKDNYIEK
jgi:hypothetical protein